MLDRGYVNISELRKSEVHAGVKVCIAPPRLARRRRRGDAHIVGCYAPTADIGAEEGLSIGVGQSEESEPPEGAL